NRNRGERQNNQEKVEIANAAPQVVGANDESEGSGDERRRGRNRRVEVVTVANEPNAMKPVARQRIQNPIQAFRWASVVAPPVCL
ncbi:MAG: hypothetical protein ACKN8Z_08360, partial [Polynucleobacter sp.]